MAPGAVIFRTNGYIVGHILDGEQHIRLNIFFRPSIICYFGVGGCMLRKEMCSTTLIFARDSIVRSRDCTGST